MRMRCQRDVLPSGSICGFSDSPTRLTAVAGSKSCAVQLVLARTSSITSKVEVGVKSLPHPLDRLEPRQGQTTYLARENAAKFADSGYC